MSFFTKIILAAAFIVNSLSSSRAQVKREHLTPYSSLDELQMKQFDKYYTIQNFNFTYNLTWPNELFFITPGVVLLGTGELLDPKVLSQEMRDNLSIDDIPAFERNLIYFDTAQAAKASNWSDGVVVFTYGINIALLLATLDNKTNTFTTAVIYAEGAFLTLGITEILKLTIGRVRPFAYNEANPDSYRFREGVTSSFPSGHTSSTAYNCFFAAKFLDDNLIENGATGLRIATWTLAATIPAVTGYLRTAAGKHFYTDIIAGYALGAGFGYVIPALHKQPLNQAQLFPIFENNYTGMRICITW